MALVVTAPFYKIVLIFDLAILLVFLVLCMAMIGNLANQVSDLSSALSAKNEKKDTVEDTVFSTKPLSFVEKILVDYIEAGREDCIPVFLSLRSNKGVDFFSNMNYNDCKMLFRKALPQDKDPFTEFTFDNINID